MTYDEFEKVITTLLPRASLEYDDGGDQIIIVTGLRELDGEMISNSQPYDLDYADMDVEDFELLDRVIIDLKKDQ